LAGIAAAADDSVSQAELEDAFDADDDDSPADVGAAGSNPLASVSKLEGSWTYLDLDGGDDYQDFELNGSWMLHPKLKLNAEIHYASTDVTGSREHDWESLSIKPILFPYDTVLSETWKLRTAVGLEWILEFGHERQGIGVGADQLAPLFGLAFNHSGWDTTLIPLVQHFTEYSGNDVSATAFRLIGLQPLPDGQWLKLDAKILSDWENDSVPADIELQYGRMWGPRFGTFVSGLGGIGGDRQFDFGIEIGVRTFF
jgi:hypothetical protein